MRSQLSSDNEALRKALAALTATERQNRLMRVVDRDIAMATSGLDTHSAELMLSAVSAEKRRRIEEEIRLQKRLRISPSQLQEAVYRLTGALSASSPTGAPRSYLRPLRRSRPDAETRHRNR